MKSTLIKFLPLVAAMMLAACGGGGGSSNSSSDSTSGNNGPVTPPTSGCPASQVMVNGSCATPADIQVSVPTPSYPSGSVEMTAFQELNAVRQAMGLGLLAQNDKLDQTAKNHTKYIAINVDTDTSVLGHYEDSKKPGYTGYAPADRGLYTGFGAYVSEVYLTKHPVLVSSAVSDFMATIYHRQLIIQQCPRNVGIGYQDHQSPNGFYAKPMPLTL